MDRLPGAVVQQIIDRLLTCNRDVSAPDQRRILNLRELFEVDVVAMATALKALFPEHEDEQTAVERFRQFRYRFNRVYLQTEAEAALRATSNKEPLRFKCVWMSKVAMPGIEEPEEPAEPQVATVTTSRPDKIREVLTIVYKAATDAGAQTSAWRLDDPLMKKFGGVLTRENLLVGRNVDMPALIMKMKG